MTPTSVALLIGVSDYEGVAEPDRLPSIPEVGENLSALERILPGTLITPDPIEVRLVRNPSSSDELAAAIAEAATVAPQTLVIYYSGHGLVTNNGSLALSNSRTSRRHADFQALDFDRVRQILRTSPAQRKYVILDCCFSGAAIGSMLDAGDLRGHLQLPGSYLLTSSPATRPSHVVPGESTTAFTGRLVAFLTNRSNRNPKPPWSANQIFNTLRSQMRSEGLPEPQSLDNNGLGDDPLFDRYESDAERPYTAVQGHEQCADPTHLALAGTGLTAFLKDVNEEDNRQIAARIRHAQNIYFIAHTGYNAMVSQYQIAIREAVKKGATLRVVVSDHKGALLKDEGLTRRLCPSIRQAGEIVDVLHACARHLLSARTAGFPGKNVQARLYEGVPSMNMLHIDRWLRVIPYLPLIDAAESPVLEFGASERSFGVVEAFLSSMEMVWQDAKPVDLSLYQS